MLKLLKKIYYSSEDKSIIRFFILQSYLILLQFFNFLLNILPFFYWKYYLCRLAGIKLGSNVTLCSGVRFLSFGNCSIGDRTIVNRACLLDNRCGLYIGADVSIATCCKLFSQGHNTNDDLFSLIGDQVVIGDHCCIYADVLVMPGVTLGDGVVVYPGSVVTKSFAKKSVVAGNPAKFLKLRKSSLAYRLGSNFWFS